MGNVPLCPVGARVNGKIQDPLSWKRITSSGSRGGDTDAALILLIKHSMATASSQCQVPQRKCQDGPGRGSGAALMICSKAYNM